MEEPLGSMPPGPRIVRGQQRLTPQQEEYAGQFAQERIAGMLVPISINEQEAEVHLREAYRVAGFGPPVTIRWFDSPIPFVLACAQDKSMWETKVDVRKSMRPLLMRLWESVEKGVREGVQEAVAREIRDAGESVWGRVMMAVIDNVEASVWESVASIVWGSTWSYRVAHEFAMIRFFHEVFEETPLIHQALLNEMVSGYLSGSEQAWLVCKPIRLEFDEQGRLHSASGKCLQFRDGWGGYAWHGVLVPEKLIMHPEEVTREDWLQEHDLEVRRVIQERLGNDRFVELVGGRCIDTGTRGNLIEVDLGSDSEGVAHYVQVRDASTQRQYYLRVPPSIRRADEAVAWTFGLDEQDYQPRQET